MTTLINSTAPTGHNNDHKISVSSVQTDGSLVIMSSAVVQPNSNKPLCTETPTDNGSHFERKNSNEINSRKKALLKYVIRMNSYQSPNPKVPPSETLHSEDQTDALSLKSVTTVNELIRFCLKQCQPGFLSEPLIMRQFIETDLALDSNSEDHFTVLQWNVLSQAIGYHWDRFDTCSNRHLLWSARKWKIMFEMVQYKPDVICLQEVDHFDFIRILLQKVGYEGHFVAKPDSPCYYLPDNTGPDGCAIFYNTSRLSLLSSAFKVLEVLKCPSNQVALICHLRCKKTGKTFCVATTHLKARKGPVLAELRDQQGKDLLDFIYNESGSLPLILTGDFNAEVNEPVYETITGRMGSAYCDNLLGESTASNWTRREDEEEIKQTVDYIFYTNNKLSVTSLLDLYSEDLNSPLPNAQFPSDHLSLAARFQFLNHN